MTILLHPCMWRLGFFLSVLGFISHIHPGKNYWKSLESRGPLNKTWKLTGRIFCLPHSKQANQISWGFWLMWVTICASLALIPPGFHVIEIRSLKDGHIILAGPHQRTASSTDVICVSRSTFLFALKQYGIKDILYFILIACYFGLDLSF